MKDTYHFKPSTENITFFITDISCGATSAMFYSYIFYDIYFYIYFFILEVGNLKEITGVFELPVVK